MKDEKWTSNLIFNIQLFWKLKNHFNSFNPWIIRWSKGDQSVHRKCHSIRAPKVPFNPCTESAQFSISNFYLKIKNWKSIFHWKWHFLYFNFDSKLKIEKKKKIQTSFSISILKGKLNGTFAARTTFGLFSIFNFESKLKYTKILFSIPILKWKLKDTFGAPISFYVIFLRSV